MIFSHTFLLQIRKSNVVDCACATRRNCTIIAPSPICASPICASYINASRIDKAKMLLDSGDYRNDEVALLCGFSETKYFYTVFKKITGMTPKEYKLKTNARLH